MNNPKAAIALALIAIAGVSAWLISHHKPLDSQTQTTSVLLPEHLPAFTLQDSAGIARNSSEWNGKVLIVNFWASWCPPCLEEIPALTEFQRQHAAQGIQVIGVAIDDPEQVKIFMQTHAVNFPVLIGTDDAMELGKKMGNRISTLPYTAIFDQQGQTLYAQPGKIAQSTLEQTIKPLLTGGSS